ncbi:hypothetical protein [Sabulicella rubraurantiaca]|uniref:hypothetical protein n=1 Tax=Sabulicella rubraurantiaca TaxID=2811429 RepID=UPI001A97D09E|nr:hypothetical protein [Sabulicella rubraurantiaca]
MAARVRPSILPFLLLLLLPGCDGPAAVATVGVNVAALMVTGRTVPDLVVSGVTGLDCSVVRLDRRLSYCASREEVARHIPYCTRSLGSVDCWVTRPAAIPQPRGVADTPPLSAQ